MIKKTGSTPPSGIKSTEVNKVNTTKVGNVSNVSQTAGVNKFRSSTREITPELKKQLLQMIEDEAEKILSGDGISERRRSKVKNALKMAIDSGNVEEEKE